MLRRRRLVSADTIIDMQFNSMQSQALALAVLRSSCGPSLYMWANFNLSNWCNSPRKVGMCQCSTHQSNWGVRVLFKAWSMNVKVYICKGAAVYWSLSGIFDTVDLRPSYGLALALRTNEYKNTIFEKQPGKDGLSMFEKRKLPLMSSIGPV